MPHRPLLRPLSTPTNSHNRSPTQTSTNIISPPPPLTTSPPPQTFSYAATGPVVTIDPIAANSCERFLPFCEALVEHLQRTVGGLKCAFNQSIGVDPRDMGRAVKAQPGAKDFLAKRRLMDPSGRFLNPFLQEVLDGVAEA